MNSNISLDTLLDITVLKAIMSTGLHYLSNQLSSIAILDITFLHDKKQWLAKSI